MTISGVVTLSVIDDKFIDLSLLLNCFSDNPARARKEYASFVNRGQNNLDLIEGIDDKYAAFNSKLYSSSDVLERKDIDVLIKATVKKYGMKIEDVLMKNTLHLNIRNELIKEIQEKSNLTLAEIGGVFGGLSESAISKIVSKKRNV